ncbi:DUF3570 domain-containing protein [Methylomonas sp. AM2-LC]|uniref:DUF3570 domain-containing protein n=1 Tax=Methylomonas sp. AM2-LC TaxID=3153301 RepID=UPI0032648ED1
MVRILLLLGIWGGASSYNAPLQTGNFFDAQGHYLAVTQFANVLDNNGNVVALVPGQLTRDNRLQHIMGYASPESRDQVNMKLGYDWDNASMDAGAGTSIEPDYESRFANLASKLDFNQKQTTLNFGLSYTSSDTRALTSRWGPTDFLSPANVQNAANINDGGIVDNLDKRIIGNRRDAAFTFSLSQVMNKNDVWTAGLGYTRTTGFQSNPYKSVTMFYLDPNWRNNNFNGLAADALPGVQYASGGAMQTEKRPELRNQLTLDTSYLHYMESLNAAAKLGYSFFMDDWGINAHTFDGEWRQDLGGSWLLTPHVRYYSQSAASFYGPYFFSYCNGCTQFDPNNNYGAPNAFSSDQRLSAYGTLSGGVSLSKQFAKGLSLELGFEYYTHKSALKIGGGGSGDYTNFDYYTVNAGVHASLGKLASVTNLFDSGSLFDGWFDNNSNSATPPEHAAHQHAHQHANAPAGVMFAHMLDQPGEWMLGYRFMQSNQGGTMLHGSQPANRSELLTAPCPGGGGNNASLFKNHCDMFATSMNMNMHMLDLMYAPTDWLNVMLMPQFVDMSMKMDMSAMPMSTMMQAWGMYGYTARDQQQSGGFGDTGAYALLRLWDGDGHHVHLTQGISIPTGTVTTRYEWSNFGYYSYDMQAGSGTWDYKPSLTYTGEQDDWYWGAQISGTHRLQSISGHGWSLGDIWQGTGWGGYRFTNWLSGTVRGVYSAQSAIHGSYPDGSNYGSFAWGNMPNQFSQNYGGSYADAGFGVTATVPKGDYAGNSASFEWLQPLYTYVNGYQLDRAGALSATWSYAF